MNLKKKYVNVIIMTMAFGLLVINVSGSITPDNVQNELEPGDCYTIEKTVSIPSAPSQVDVIFSFDLTNSMGDILDAAKQKTEQIIISLVNSYPEVSFTFGVMSHMDYPDTYASCGYDKKYGYSGIDYAYSLDQPLTDVTNDVIAAINGLNLGFGADGPENYARIFFESYNDSNVGWRTDANKLLVNFGDNVSHDCNLNEGITSGTWTTGKDPGPDEIVNNGDDLDLQFVLGQMNANDITLIECHSSESYYDYWNYWAGLTGGSVHLINSTNFVDNVTNAITSELASSKIYNLELVVATPGFETWLYDVDPPIYAEVDTGTSVTFNETICVPADTPPGYYEFIVSAVDGDGNNYGNQTPVKPRYWRA